jgi:hypothetical protein
MGCGFSRSTRNEAVLIFVEPVVLVSVPFESAEDDFFKDFSKDVYYTFRAEVAEI